MTHKRYENFTYWQFQAEKLELQHRNTIIIYSMGCQTIPTITTTGNNDH